MNRAEFMRQLEHLLRNISESERQEALDYYNSYFDDAGAENESKVIQELGSPGKVAAIIKADLAGSAKEYAEYTDQGYQDSRQQKTDMPEVYEYGGESQSRAQRGYQPPAKRNNKGNLILILIILVLSCWLWGPILLGILGAAFGIMAAIVAVVFAVGICGVAFVVGGIAIVVMGMVKCFSNPGVGLLAAAGGFIMAALGVLLTLLFVWIAVKFLPWFVRKIAEVCQKLLHRTGKKEGVSV